MKFKTALTALATAALLAVIPRGLAAEVDRDKIFAPSDKVKTEKVSFKNL